MSISPERAITNIEGIGFDGANTATFNASQFGLGLIATTSVVNGANGTIQNVVVQTRRISRHKELGALV